MLGTLLNNTRVRFGEILAAGRPADADYDTFMAGLWDPIVYLEYDLNPGAAASLDEDGKKLNTHADNMFESRDGASRRPTSPRVRLKKR
jgi:hypothetical protein